MTSWASAIDAGIDALTHSGFYGMAGSLVAAEDRDRFSEFFLPNEYGKFDPAQFESWLAASAGWEEHARDLGNRLSRSGVPAMP